MSDDRPVVEIPTYEPGADREAEFEREVRPLVDAMREKCRALGVPFAAAYLVGPDTYEGHVWVPAGCDSRLLIAMSMMIFPAKTREALAPRRQGDAS